MSKDSSDFMIEEYQQIAKAFGDLYNVISRMFHFYLLICAVPLSVATLIYKDSGNFNILELPPPLPWLFISIGLIGFCLCATMVNMRMEQLLYARTVNCIRRYFAELSPQPPLIKGYLVLPTTDSIPPFFETWRFFFWQVLVMGVIDGAFLWLGLSNAFGGSCRLCLSSVLSFVFLGGHLIIYWLMAQRREKRWHVAKGKDENFKDNY